MWYPYRRISMISCGLWRLTVSFGKSMRRTIWSSFLLSCCYLVGRLYIVEFLHPPSPYWRASIIFPVVFFFAMAEIVWSKNAFYKLEGLMVALFSSRKHPAVQRWYRKRIEWMYDPMRSTVTALLFIPLLIVVQQSIGWNSWIEDPLLRGYDTICQTLMLGAAAGSQWPFANISAFVMRLPTKGFSVNFYAHPKDSIMSLASLLLKIDLGGVMLTFLISIALFISPVSIPPLIYGLLISVFLWAGAWFFLTQYAIHESMQNEKRNRLRLVSERMMKIMDSVATNPNPANQREFEELKHVYDAIVDLPEWPFRTQTVLTLTSGVLVPVAITILDLLMKR